MEIRTSTANLYENQTNNITYQSSQLQNFGNELSSGVSLNLPSDDPIAVSQVMQLSNDISTSNTQSANAQQASNQLTTVDGSLSNLTDILQQANSIAVQGANGLLSQSDRTALSNQVGQLFNEAVSIANTQYQGSYIFAGTAYTPGGPVAVVGSPPSGVTVSGNNQVLSENFGADTTVPLSTSLQQAFNTNSADGSPDVFQTLLNLQTALSGSNVTIESNGPVTTTGNVVTSATTLGSAAFAKALTPDSTGDYSITIAAASGSQTFTFTPATTIATVVSTINASPIGVTAAYNQRDASFSLSSSQAFNVTDAKSPGATNTANLVEALGLTNEADTATDISDQINDVGNVLNVALSARSVIGATIQSLSTLQSSYAAQSTTETASKSSLTDTDIAKVSTQFSLAQTALQAAYIVTSKIEGHMLFDYLPAG